MGKAPQRDPADPWRRIGPSSGDVRIPGIGGVLADLYRAERDRACRISGLYGHDTPALPEHDAGCHGLAVPVSGCPARMDGIPVPQIRGRGASQGGNSPHV